MVESIHGRSSQGLQDEITNGGGLLVTKNLARSIATLPLSVDELVFLSKITRDLYSNARLILQQGLDMVSSFDGDQRKVYSNRFFDRTDIRDSLPFRVGIHNLYDALNSQNTKPYLKSEEAMFEAVSSKLTLLELEGYEAARLAKELLNASRAQYFEVENNVRAFFRSLAEDHVAHTSRS